MNHRPAKKKGLVIPGEPFLCALRLTPDRTAALRPLAWPTREVPSPSQLRLHLRPSAPCHSHPPIRVRLASTHNARYRARALLPRLCPAARCTDSRPDALSVAPSGQLPD